MSQYSESDAQDQTYWRRQAWLVALRFNVGWWLSFFVPIWFFINLVFACAVIYARRSHVQTDLLWMCYLCLTFVWAILSAYVVRGKFFTNDDALRHMESVLQLNNQLSCALEGIAPWPKARIQATNWLVRWRWSSIFGPVAGSLGVIGVAVIFPIVPLKEQPRIPIDEPLTWSQVEEWVESLEAEELVEQNAIDELKEQLSTLKNNDATDWFDHGGLEAGDALKEQTEESLGALSENLKALESELGRLEQEFKQEVENREFDEGTRESHEESEKNREERESKAGQRAQQQKKFERLLRKLQNGGLPLSSELMEKLKEIPLDDLDSLDSESLEALRDRLKQGEEALGAMLGKGKSDEEPNGYVMIPGSSAPGGDMTGNGGVDRGPGSAPLEITSELTPELNSRVEGVEAQKQKDLIPGELIGMSRGAPEVDTTVPMVPQSGGGIRSPGKGGVNVWKGNFTPSEKELLKNYFKE